MSDDERLLIRSVVERNLDNLSQFLHAQVGPNTVDKGTGKSAIQTAINNGFVEGVEVLLKFGARYTPSMSELEHCKAGILLLLIEWQVVKPFESKYCDLLESNFRLFTQLVSRRSIYVGWKETSLQKVQRQKLSEARQRIIILVQSGFALTKSFHNDNNDSFNCCSIGNFLDKCHFVDEPFLERVLKDRTFLFTSVAVPRYPHHIPLLERHHLLRNCYRSTICVVWFKHCCERSKLSLGYLLLRCVRLCAMLLPDAAFYLAFHLFSQQYNLCSSTERAVATIVSSGNSNNLSDVTQLICNSCASSRPVCEMNRAGFYSLLPTLTDEKVPLVLAAMAYLQDQYGVDVVCEFDYDGEELDLSFKKGDIIEVIERDKSNWWKGRLQNSTSKEVKLFPSNYCTLRRNTDRKLKLFHCALPCTNILEIACMCYDRSIEHDFKPFEEDY